MKRNMKDFKITVSLEENELLIIEEHRTGVKSYVENEEDVARCIKNYIEIYVEKALNEKEKQNEKS